jgi:hypothetical protein
MKLMPKFIPVRPDFMAQGPNIKIEKKEGLLVEQSSTQMPDERAEDEDFVPYRYYESQKILGKLFRAIDEHEIFSDLHKYRMPSSNSEKSLLDQLWSYVKKECRLVHWKQHLILAQEIRDMYEDCLLNIMKTYSEHPLRPMSELEAFIGNILGAQGSQSRRQRDLSVPKEAFDRDVAFIIGCIRGNRDEEGEDVDSENGDGYEALARSVACFEVSLGEATRVPQGGRKNEPLVSFRYIAAAVCLKEMERVFG